MTVWPNIERPNICTGHQNNGSTFHKCTRTVFRRWRDDGKTNLHLVRRFWNHVLTCASVIFRVLARVARSALARYFCLWNRFSNSQICTLEKDVRGFFRLGGVRFWYGCPIRRVTVKGTWADGESRLTDQWRCVFTPWMRSACCCSRGMNRMASIWEIRHLPRLPIWYLKHECLNSF